MRKRRIGTAKFFTLLLLLYHTSAKVAGLYKIISIVTIAALIGFPISVIASHNVLGTSISYADTIKYQGTHPVMMKEIDPENWALVQEGVDTEVWPEDIGYTIDNYWDGLFKRIVTEDVRIHETADDGVVYIASCYNARSSGIALQYLKEDVPYIVDEDVTMDGIKISWDGVDYVGYYASNRDSFQYIFVLNGTQLETVVYRGDKNLKDYIKLYVDDISNK